MAGIKVDEMGNCWAADDTERRYPAAPHPELEGEDAKCPRCGRYKWRLRRPDDSFEWRCGCGEVFEGFHH